MAAVIDEDGVTCSHERGAVLARVSVQVGRIAGNSVKVLKRRIRPRDNRTQS